MAPAVHRGRCCGLIAALSAQAIASVGAATDRVGMTTSYEPFIGSEALARRVLNRHQLRSRYRALYPNVYLAKDVQPTLSQRTTAAWMWSGRQ